MLISSDNEQGANRPSQAQNSSNSQSHLKSSLGNKLHKKLQNRLIDIDKDELNTYYFLNKNLKKRDLI
jgi:hypothetical protein